MATQIDWGRLSFKEADAITELVCGFDPSVAGSEEAAEGKVLERIPFGADVLEPPPPPPVNADRARVHRYILPTGVRVTMSYSLQFNKVMGVCSLYYR